MMTFFSPLQLIFCFFAMIAVISALAVITARNPVHSVLSLVITFFAMAGIWMLLQAEFLSLILLLVYVGAVMTLFLFVVMMLNIDQESKKSGFVKYLPFGLMLVLLLVVMLIMAISPRYFGSLMSLNQPLTITANSSNLYQVGSLLYTDYVYPFEIAGVLLLAAIIAAITLTHRKPRRKMQDPSAQIAIQPSDRVRLIKIPPQTKNEGA